MKMLHYPDKVNKTIILSDAIVLSNLWISMIVHRRNLMGKLVVHPSISDLKLVKLVFRSERSQELALSLLRHGHFLNRESLFSLRLF